MSISINREKIKTYAVSILVPLVLGAIVGVLTTRTMHYENLVKPPLAPPAILFPIAWSILYALMGISAARIALSARSPERTAALEIYLLQLAVNFFWSLFFFNFRAYAFSFFWLLGLWGLILWMIVRMRRVERPAGNLQIPYLLWVTFAGYLNLGVWLLN